MFLLDRIRDLLDKQPPDTLFAQWDGALYKDEDELVRYDKFFLMVARKLKGEYIFQKMPACLGKLPNSEAYIFYTDRPVVRVLNGGRANKCYPASGTFFPSEKTIPAGIWKRLEYGKDGNQFTRRQGSDVYYLEILKMLETEGYVPWRTPAWYITGRNLQTSELFVRQSAHAFLSSFRRDSENLWTTFDRIKDTLRVSAGYDSEGFQRLGYPFNLVYGRGVKAAAIDVAGVWMKTTVREMTEKLPDMRIYLESEKD